MDFQAAMETFAEAWVAANTISAINNDSQETQPLKSSTSSEDLPTMVKQTQLTRPGGKGVLLAGSGGLLQPINMIRGATAVTTGPEGVKSMPIHCIVEQMTAPPGGSPSNHDANPRPLHVSTIKPSPGAPSSNNKSNASSSVELDTYAILPGTTLFSDLVRTALIKIGYTAAEALGAKGSIQIKNWKALTFDTITENPNCTVDDILGDLMSIATLRIRLCRRTARQIRIGISGVQMQQFRALGFGKDSHKSENLQWTDELVRCAVIDLLNEINQSTMAKLSPLAQSTISNIANSKYLAKISNEKCAEFGRWYQAYKKSKYSNATAAGPPQVVDTSNYQKDKIRLTFHPIHELPKLREWYVKFSNPTEEMFHFFASEMNEGCMRKERRKVSVRKLKIWWRNEKVRQKRLKERAERGEEMVRKRGRKKKVLDDSMDLSAEVAHSPRSPSSCRGHDTLHSEEEGLGLEDRSLDPGVLSPCSASSPVDERSYMTINRNMLPPYQGPVYPIPYQPPPGPSSNLSHNNQSTGHNPNISHGDISQAGGSGGSGFPKPTFMAPFFLHSRDEDQNKLLQPSPSLHHHLPYHN